MIRVWDGFIRFFHWTMVGLVILAWVTESLYELHSGLGYGIAILLVFRIFWGFIGSHYARFKQFMHPPATIIKYAKLVTRHQEPRYVGHNPLGGLMIIALLATLIAICISGIFMSIDSLYGNEFLEEAHEFFTNILIILVIMHVVGVIFSSLRHRENLIKSMMTGIKRHDEKID